MDLSLVEQMKREQMKMNRPTKLNLLYAQAYSYLPPQLQTFLPQPIKQLQIPDYGNTANKESHMIGASNAKI